MRFVSVVDEVTTEGREDEKPKQKKLADNGYKAMLLDLAADEIEVPLFGENKD